LVSFYAPEIYSIPSDLVLGLLLVSVKQESFTFAETVAVSWTESIPNAWCRQLQSNFDSIAWDNLDDSNTEGIERLCFHYDSILKLYIAHALVGQARWATIPGIVRKDRVLSPMRQSHLNDLVDQAYQEYEASLKITLDQPSQSATAVSSSSPVSRSTSLAIKTPPFLARFQTWSRSFFNSHNVKPAVITGIAALVIVVWITKRSSNNKSWGMIWLLRILRSLRPALPPTS